MRVSMRGYTYEDTHMRMRMRVRGRMRGNLFVLADDHHLRDEAHWTMQLFAH